MKRPKEALQPVSLMNRVPRTSLLAFAVLAALPVAPVRGAALGELAARSVLGAPLNAEIRITPGPGEQLDGQCIRVVRGQSDDLPWITGARVRLEGERLIVTTRDHHRRARSRRRRADAPARVRGRPARARRLRLSALVLHKSLNHAIRKFCAPDRKWRYIFPPPNAALLFIRNDRKHCDTLHMILL